MPSYRVRLAFDGHFEHVIMARGRWDSRSARGRRGYAPRSKPGLAQTWDAENSALRVGKAFSLDIGCGILGPLSLK